MDSTAEQIRDLEDDLHYLRREIEDGLLDRDVGVESIEAYEARIAWKKELLARERRAQLQVIRRRPKQGLWIELVRLSRPLRDKMKK